MFCSGDTLHMGCSVKVDEYYVHNLSVQYESLKYILSVVQCRFLVVYDSVSSADVAMAVYNNLLH